jgi:DNA primase
MLEDGMNDQGSFSFRELKKRVSIDQVLATYGLDGELKVQDNQLRGACPLHGGKNPTAFRVHLSRGIWHCFSGCGGGDVVELIRRIEHCGYAEAARHLNRIAQGQIPVSPATTIPTTTTVTEKNSRPFRPFRFSIPLQPRVPFLQRDKGIHQVTAARFEAGRAEGSSFLRDTVAVRLHDINGHPMGYCGRRLQPEHVTRFGKWRFPQGFPKSEILYNAHRALSARAQGIVVVECPWAVMRLAQAGVTGAVALLGTTMSEVQARWLSQASVLLLMLDGDEAGRKAATIIAERLATSTTVSVHQLPESLEPEDLSDHQLAAAVRSSSSLNQYSSSRPLGMHHERKGV